MYKPAPLRPKKTNITRTRTGCLGCRARRVKCDEKIPICGRCERLGGECTRSAPLKFRQVYQPGAAEKLSTKNRASGRGLKSATRHKIPENGTDSLEEITANNSVDLVRNPIPVELAHSSPTLPQVLLPRFDPAEAVKFYSTTWDWQCLAPFAAVLRTGDAFSLGSSPLFMDMMVAVSASHLSRTSPRRRLLTPSSIPEQNFRPDPGHEAVSQEFYGSVMMKMARWSEHDFDARPVLGLALITLFCLIESSMGSFQTFGLHYEAATKLVQNYTAGSLAWNCQAGDVLEPLVETQMQMWWRRVYFGTLNFHRHRPKVSLNSSFKGLEGLNSRRTSILPVLCEAHRINNAATIAHWDALSKANSYMPEGVESAGEVQWGSDSFSQLISGEKARLHAWCQLWSFPCGIGATRATAPTTAARLEVHPLHMASHQDAMDAAYYIATKVLQSNGPLASLSVEHPEEIRGCYVEVESWIHLLLRVVAGMDWQACVRLNMYTIGITGILIACLLRSHDPRLGLWCEEWLRNRLDGSSFEEGNFPVLQTMNIIRLINKERSEGCDVFGLFQTVEDGGGSGKFGSYQSQALSSLLLYSRCRETGLLHSHFISI